MVIREMTAEECRALLAATGVMRLACARHNQPYIVPINLDLDGESLYGYATCGQKIEWMRENPLVCLEGEVLVSPEEWSSVVVFGRYEELPPTPKNEGARTTAERLFQRHPAWWEPASVTLSDQGQRHPVVFRIRIARMTGRTAAPDRHGRNGS